MRRVVVLEGLAASPNTIKQFVAFLREVYTPHWLELRGGNLWLTIWEDHRTTAGLRVACRLYCIHYRSWLETLK